jgi:hypothetical protein
MKSLLVVCLGVILSSPLSESFTRAERLGEPYPRTFFNFSTSAGNYIVRDDGMGEFTSPKGLRRAFYLKAWPNGRLECLYYLEHEGDLFWLYEVKGKGFYLARMEQTQRKLRWLTPLPDLSAPEEDPIINGDAVFIGKATMISKADGRIVKQD